MACELIEARSYAEAIAFLADRLTEVGSGQPFRRLPLLVDSHAIGQNFVAHMAALRGMAVGIAPELLPAFLGRIATGVEAARNPNATGRSGPLLGARAVALAIAAIVPKLRNVSSTKTIAAAIADAPPDRKLPLATEVALALDTALLARLDPAERAPWVAGLVKALTQHARQIEDGRLLEYLQRWPRMIQALEAVSADAKLRETMRRNGCVPEHVFGFDLSAPPECPAAALRALAQAVPVTIITVQPVTQTPSCSAADSWGARSLRPVQDLATSLEVPWTTEPGRLRAVRAPVAAGNSALAAVQRCVAGIARRRAQVPEGDDSLSMHQVASQSRAAEVARDILHQAFSELPDLLPEQVVLLSDDPRRDAPFVDAAFAAVANETIPTAITNLNTRDRDIGVDAYLTALQLGPSSYAAEPVFALAAMAPVAESLGLDTSEADELARVCGQVGLRAYVDADHRRQVIGKAAGGDACSWTAALDALATSMAVPDGGHEVVTAGGIVPGGTLQSTDMHQLAALAKLIEVLRTLLQLVEGGTIADLTTRARTLLNLLLPPRGRWRDSHRVMEMALDRLESDAAATGFAGDIDFFWYRNELTGRLNRSGSRVCPLHGGVSLITPAQARGRSPRVAICLLTDHFPAEDRRVWPAPYVETRQPGDPCQRDADLRDFLLVFMNTRERFAVVAPAVCGRTGQALATSSVVHDIRAVARSVLGEHADRIEHADSVVAHSLTAMQSRVPTRHRGAIAGAHALYRARTGSAQPQVFAVLDQDEQVPDEISLEDFVSFFEDSTRAFLRHRHAYIRDISDGRELREPIEPTYLERWQVRNTVYELKTAALASGDPALLKALDQVLPRLRAAGIIRTDLAGERYYSEQYHATIDMVMALRGEGSTWHNIDIKVPYSLHGRQYALRIHGDILKHDGFFTRERLGSFRAKYALGVAAFESVLAYAGRKEPWRVVLIDSSKPSIARSSTDYFPNRCAAPIALVALVRLWHVGLQMPLPIFPGPIAEALGDQREPYLPAAVAEFDKPDQEFGPGEGRQAGVRALFRGHNPLTSALALGAVGGASSDFERIARLFVGGVQDAFDVPGVNI